MTAVTNYWPTPIYRTNINDNQFIDELMPKILDINRRHHPRFVDIPRTDHSAIQDEIRTSYDEGDPTFVNLFTLLEAHVRCFYREGFGIDNIATIIKPWGQVYYQNENLPYHNHETILSGVLYLAVPGAEIQFHDPRGNANRGYPSEFDDAGTFDPVTILPEPGDIVIFPSYLFHSVMTNFSRAPRVVVPFDVNIHN